MRLSDLGAAGAVNAPDSTSSDARAKPLSDGCSEIFTGKRHPVDRIKMTVLPGGKDAVTHYNVKERFQHFTRVQARLETGRTHQIRVHFSYIGHGLIGDPVYMPRVRVPAGASELLNETLRGFKRQALHAAKLGLVHPRTKQDMMFEAPWPEDFSQLVDVLRSENAAY